ncbi:hypothetical protein V1504DRAFT_276901 [Lipomyces starkeyi]
MWSEDLTSGVIYFKRHDLTFLTRRQGESPRRLNLVGQESHIFHHPPHRSNAYLLRRWLHHHRRLPRRRRWGLLRGPQVHPRAVGSSYSGGGGTLNLTGFYAVGTAVKAKDARAEFQDSHCVRLERGFTATGRCPDGKIRWDLVLPENEPPPSAQLHSISPSPDVEPWQASILPSQYSSSSTISILRQQRNVFHPYTGTFESLFSSADGIIRTPLRQRLWKQDEMQWGNAVLLGDAARLMLPTSGQDTVRDPRLQR